jgi:tetratricopeptide (TPR) repeat protein
MYANEIERRRPDIIAIDIQQLRRSWYYPYLRRAYPYMIEQARDKVDAFLEDLTHWEQDHDLYQRELSLNQRINTRFYDMIQAFVINHLGHNSVYVTQDVALNREGEDSELTKWLSDTYQPVPQGLVFQVAEKDATVQLVDVQLVTRGLADGTLKFEADDVVNLKVIPAYLNMLYSRGRYLAAHGRHAEAINAFQQALDINMNLGVVQQALNESQTALRKSQTGTNP